MAETIESFVAKLQEEGVQAGRSEADKIRRQAQEEAEKVLADARDEAQKILADAKKQGEEAVARGRTELELAARDVTLRLKEALEQALADVLAAGTKRDLDDTEFLAKVLHDIILTYAKNSAEKIDSIKINVSKELRDKLSNWALGEIGQKKLDELDISLDLKGRLEQAGFEYTVDGATVEVTLPSVVESLCEMVSPALREIVDKAVSGKE